MPVLAQERVARDIKCGTIATLMGFAIHLNGKARRAAIKVDHIGTNAVTLSELHTQFLPAQLLPEQDLGQRHFFA